MATALASLGRTIRVPLKPAQTAFFLCDIQERFRPLIHEFPAVVATASKMVAASKILDIPMYVTEQNPKALGQTVPELTINHAVWRKEKSEFSMWNEDLDAQLKAASILSIVLFGIESHVCITQTALDLLAGGKGGTSGEGYRVYVLADGVSSMNANEVPVALSRLAREGAIISTSESVLFELLGDAAHPRFKAISALVKASKESTSAALSALIPAAIAGKAI